MRIYYIIIFFSCLFLSCSPTEEYDVIIKNGLIYNGSGNKPFKGDIAIRGDQIVAIGTLDGVSDRAIDAEGHAVAPGFINMLSWANVSLLEDGRSQSDLRQGVTLEVMGEGRSMGPLNEDMKTEMKENQGDIKYDIPWTTLGEYLEYLEEKGVSTNVASFVGNGTLRTHVIGYDNRPATPEEITKMQKLLAMEMEAGAVGISSSLLYAPSMYADTEELIELSRTASKYKGLYISHIRDEGDRLLESIEELITISREANIDAEVYHLKASGVDNHHKMDSVIAMIEDARAEGLHVTADMYTYNASSTGLHVQLPDWVRDGGIERMISRLKDRSLRNKIVADTKFSNPPETTLMVGFRNPDLRKYIGRYLDDIALELGVSPAEAVIDLIVEDDSRIQVVYFSMSEDNIRKKIALPWMSFCSDAGSYTNEGVFIKQSTHPRAYGSFIRVLGKYGRDENLYPLQDGIRRLTSLPAENLKIKNRGLLKEGYFADVVIFDPEKVSDKATFEDPHQYAEGVTDVLVNGVQVIKDGEHTGATPGRFIKGPGYKKD